MDITIFLAQFWGWMLVILSLIFLLRGKELIEEMVRSVSDRGFSLTSGYIALILGLATVLLHNTWTLDWQGVVTLFGWISILKGVMRIGFPEVVPKMVNPIKGKAGSVQVLLVVTFVLGLWLITGSY